MSFLQENMHKIINGDCLDILKQLPDKCVDCFSGSGTTAVACHNLRRNFICIEKDFDYWKASCKRLEDARKQLSLFGADWKGDRHGLD